MSWGPRVTAAAVAVSKSTLHFGYSLALLVACTSCGGGEGGLTSVSGQALVDGAPIDIGTISITPANNEPGKRGAGGPIANGRFEIVSDDGLAPGDYIVAIQASKKTGRTVKDPQRGEVAEIVPLPLIDSPKRIELTSDNAADLRLEFATGKN